MKNLDHLPYRTSRSKKKFRALHLSVVKPVLSVRYIKVTFAGSRFLLSESGDVVEKGGTNMSGQPGRHIGESFHNYS